MVRSPAALLCPNPPPVYHPTCPGFWIALLRHHEAKAEFASVADGWVVAYAKANGLVVVTHEEYAPDARRNVPIPNVCVEFDVA